MRRLRPFFREYSFPATTEPAWKDSVDRWYQLDGAAYSLADASFHWQKEASRPNFIFLASAAASNPSDIRFAGEGATSPSKFVHTLPNVRASALCQVMTWSGPMLCIQNDPGSARAALEEALQFSTETFPTIWVMGVRSTSEVRYQTYLFEVSSACLPAIAEPALTFRLGEETTDDALFYWFLAAMKNQKSRFHFSQALGISSE